MNNCIGYFNQKHFLLFLIYSEIISIYSITLLVMRATYCQIYKDSELCKKPIRENSVNLMIGIICLVLLSLFTLFISIMIYDQLKCIAYNTTGIESLKKELTVERTKIENFSEAFGGKFSIKWLLPVSISGSIDEYLSKFTLV